MHVDIQYSHMFTAHNASALTPDFSQHGQYMGNKVTGVTYLKSIFNISF